VPPNKRANMDGFLSKQNSVGNVSSNSLRMTSLPKRSRASLRAKVLTALRDSRKQNWSSRKLAEDQAVHTPMWRNCGLNYKTAGWASAKTVERSSPRGYKSSLAYWKSVDRLPPQSREPFRPPRVSYVQSTSSLIYGFAHQKDLLETLKEKLSAVTTALNQEQKLIADHLAAVKGGMKQVDAVLDSLKSLRFGFRTQSCAT
jgi:hypothetical protein